MEGTDHFFSQQKTLLKIEGGMERPYFEQVDLEITKGGVHYLLGPNSSGKTHLIETILEGRHTKKIFLGQDVKVIRIPHVTRLFQNRTVEENLNLAFDQRSYPRKSDFLNERESLLKALGLEDKLRLFPKDLSNGIQRKIIFLRALLARPDLLIIDGLTIHLDDKELQKVLDVLNYFTLKQKLTLLICTSRKEVTRYLTGKIFTIDGQRIISKGYACFTS